MKKLLIVILSLSLVIPAQKLEATMADNVAFALMVAGPLVISFFLQKKLDRNFYEKSRAKKINGKQEAPREEIKAAVRGCLQALTLNGIDRS